MKDKELKELMSWVVIDIAMGIVVGLVFGYLIWG